MRKLFYRFSVWTLFSLSLVVLPAMAGAQPLPPVRAFVENLDVRCYRIPNQPPLNLPLRLDHLNPVLADLPAENVILQEPQHLCVPVQKNDQVPPPEVLPFIRFVDWKCYRIGGPPLNLPLQLDHLNREIAALFGPFERVTVREPQQLCVPVVKDNVFPPPEVRRLVEWLDVKCYRVDAVQQLVLTHLNPLFQDMAPETTQLLGRNPLQLCVPVAKNQVKPTDDILQYIQFSDVLCYPLRGAPLNRNLLLTHLNPVLQEMGAPPEHVFVTTTEKLCVPVAKNQMFPPG
jgi:hypothetical protein